MTIPGMEPLHIDRRTTLAGLAGIAALSASGVARAAAPDVPPMVVKPALAILQGIPLRYRSEAGETVLRNAQGTPRATIFSASYIAEGRSAQRPVSFIFNGGPGGATWPLHSTVSPRQFARADTPRGFAIVNNPDSPIDASDLVFLDAPGTGFSRFFAEDAKPEYWGIEEDAAAVSLFIEDWLRRHGRTGSPVHLFGESYGGTRIAQILRILALRPVKPLRIAGIVLVSPALGTGGGGLFLDTPQPEVLMLPTLASIARWHGRGLYTSLPVEKVAELATDFAETRYRAALRQSDTPSGPAAEAVARELAGFLGLAPDLLLRERLRVSMARFGELLLADEGKRLYGSDARETRVAPPPGQALSVMQSADGYDLSAAINALLREELGYATSETYRRDPSEPSRMWNNKTSATPWKLADVTAAVVAANPKFRVFLMTGYYDLLIPFRLPVTGLQGLPAANFAHATYPAGHATFSDMVVRPGAARDLRSFYRGGSPA